MAYQSPKPYPFIHPQGIIKYANIDNIFIQEAKKISLKSGCVKQATGAVIVVNNEIVARGANSGLKIKICPRVLNKCPTGVGYNLCKNICRQTGHAETVCVDNFKKSNFFGQPAELYLYGHWWCCEPCWNAMIEAGINTVYLTKNATELFST